jgi:hypothetical protein
MPNSNNNNTNKLLRENSFRIVGKLVATEINYGVRKDNGQEYVSATATINSVIEGTPCEYEVSFFASKLTKDGKESQLFVSYSKLNELEGKKVDISGEIRENRYWSSNLGQMISAQQLSGRFVRGVAESTADLASFTLGGFIVKTPVEKTNKNGDVYRYDVTLGQSNFKGDGMSMFVLHVNPAQREIIAGVEGYEVGTTVKLNGTLKFVVEQVTVEDTNNAFGAAVTKTFTNKQKNFYIEGGSNPIDDESAYTPEVIKNLIDAYKANDVKLANGAKDVESTAPATAAAPVTKRQTSLI